MQTPADLNQAIQAMQHEIQKMLDIIKQKENLHKETEAKNNGIDQEIKKDDGMIRQKQQEVLRLQQEMDTKKRELTAGEKTANQLKQEIERLKLEQLQKNNAIGALTHQQRDALNQTSIRR